MVPEDQMHDLVRNDVTEYEIGQGDKAPQEIRLSRYGLCPMGTTTDLAGSSTDGLWNGGTAVLRSNPGGPKRVFPDYANSDFVHALIYF